MSQVWSPFSALQPPVLAVSVCRDKPGVSLGVWTPRLFTSEVLSVDGLIEVTLLSLRHQVIMVWWCPWLVDHLSEPPLVLRTRACPMPVAQWWFPVVSPCLVLCWKREAGSALHCGSCWPLAGGGGD